jgi:hypothetical protein
MGRCENCHHRRQHSDHGACCAAPELAFCQMRFHARLLRRIQYRRGPRSSNSPNRGAAAIAISARTISAADAERWQLGRACAENARRSAVPDSPHAQLVPEPLDQPLDALHVDLSAAGILVAEHGLELESIDLAAVGQEMAGGMA